MARQVGRNARLWASLTNGGKAVPIADTTGWDVNQTRTKIDQTCQGDNSKVYGTGLPDGQGSYSGIFNDTATAASIAAALDGLSRTIYGYLNTALTAYFYCTALFDASVTTTVDGNSEVKGTWSADTPVYWVGV